METTTAGIDLAVQDRSTAVCEVDWSTHVATVRRGENNVQEMLETSKEGVWVGIDVPLGWPTCFASNVSRYMEGDPWSDGEGAFEEDYPGLRLRVTDLWLEWEMRDAKIHPISVSADKLGAPAMRAAWLMTQANLHDVDRADPAKHHVVEVYPKAALARWGILPASSYKKPGQEASINRSHIVQGIEDETGIGFRGIDDTPTHDEVDALVAALVARATALGHVVTAERARQQWMPEAGTPDVDFSRVSREGWIHVPCECGLAASLRAGATCQEGQR